MGNPDGAAETKTDEATEGEATSTIELLTSQEVADSFKITKRQLRRLNIPAVFLGPRSKRYRRSDLEAYIESRKKQNAKQNTKQSVKQST